MPDLLTRAGEPAATADKHAEAERLLDRAVATAPDGARFHIPAALRRRERAGEGATLDGRPLRHSGDVVHLEPSGGGPNSADVPLRRHWYE